MKVHFWALLTAFVWSVLPVCGQKDLRGRVVDENGSPLRGAIVQVKKSNMRMVTGDDGYFTVPAVFAGKKLQINATGYNERTEKMKIDQSFRLKRTTRWNKRPSRYEIFAGVEAGFPSPKFTDYPFGAFVGICKNIGVYGKFLFGSKPDVMGSIDDDWWGNSPYFLKENSEKAGYSSFGGGLMLRLGCPFYLTVGASSVERTYAYEHENGAFLKSEKYSYKGIAGDLGMICRFNHIFVNGGASYCFDGEVVTAFAGIGYIF